MGLWFCHISFTSGSTFVCIGSTMACLRFWKRSIFFSVNPFMMMYLLLCLTTWYNTCRAASCLHLCSKLPHCQVTLCGDADYTQCLPIFHSDQVGIEFHLQQHRQWCKYLHFSAFPQAAVSQQLVLPLYRKFVPNGVKLALFFFSFLLHWTLSALMFPQSVLLWSLFIQPSVRTSSLRKATMMECDNFFLYILAFLFWEWSYFFNIMLFLLFPLIGSQGNF